MLETKLTDFFFVHFKVFITEKRDGLLDRSWIAGVLPSEVLFSHVVTQFIVLCGQVAITLVFILLVFGIPNLGPVGWLIGLALAQGTAGMTYGMISQPLETAKRLAAFHYDASEVLYIIHN